MKPLLPLLLLMATSFALDAHYDDTYATPDSGHEPTELKGAGCPLNKALADRLLYDFCDEYGDDICYRPIGKTQALASVRCGTSDFALLPLNKTEQKKLRAQGLCPLALKGKDLFFIIRTHQTSDADRAEEQEQRAALSDLWRYL